MSIHYSQTWMALLIGSDRGRLPNLCRVQIGDKWWKSQADFNRSGCSR